jgi:hypothetical protein
MDSSSLVLIIGIEAQNVLCSTGGGESSPAACTALEVALLCLLEGAMSLGMILIIILIILLLGGFSGRLGGRGYGMGHSGNGLLGVILVVVLVLVLLGKL